MNAARLRPVPPPQSGPPPHHRGGGGDYGERLARLEARMDFLATKEEIQKIKVWVLSGVLGGIVAGMGLAAGLAVVVVRVLFS